VEKLNPGGHQSSKKVLGSHSNQIVDWEDEEDCTLTLKELVEMFQ
jgi:hypothetical protein